MKKVTKRGESLSDIKFMKLALCLARKAQGLTGPNPAVGAVVVSKDGEIVGRGFHRGYGKAHAEEEALKQAKSAAKSGSLYVTLEPCNHFGKNPPCVDLIRESRVKKVVFAIRDNNRQVSGSGSEALKQTGIEVVEGVCKEQALILNFPWFFYNSYGRPFILGKVAKTLDSKIALSDGSPVSITCKLSTKSVHKLRSLADAIVIGANTLLKDDPLLTNRSEKGLEPLRVILLGELQISDNFRIFRESKKGSKFEIDNLIFTRNLNQKDLGSKNKVVRLLEKNRANNLEQVVAELNSLGAKFVIVEGGAQTITSFIESGLIDALRVYQSPDLMGEGMSWYLGKGVSSYFSHYQTRKIGRDTCSTYLTKKCFLEL